MQCKHCGKPTAQRKTRHGTASKTFRAYCSAKCTAAACYIRHKEKHNARGREYYKRNRAKLIAYAAAWHQANKEKRNAVRRAWELRTYYGLTVEAYEAILN